MLANLLKSRRTRTQPTGSIPPGQRVYAIGDIHGCDALLEQLLTAIAADEEARGPARTTLIFLGDLIDRGPASAAVVERLRQLAADRPDTRFLLGNHEEIFMGALDGEPKALRLFCRVGGRETAISYGIDAQAYDRMDYEEFSTALQRQVPAEHRAFLATFEDLIVIGDYVFVHAGVRPGVALDAQRSGDLRWIRDPFLDHGRPLEKIVVHGHTISDELDIQPHRIGVDTGAYSTGRLTALGLEGGASWTVQVA